MSVAPANAGSSTAKPKKLVEAEFVSAVMVESSCVPASSQENLPVNGRTMCPSRCSPTTYSSQSISKHSSDAELEVIDPQLPPLMLRSSPRSVENTDSSGCSARSDSDLSTEHDNRDYTFGPKEEYDVSTRQELRLRRKRATGCMQSFTAAASRSARCIVFRKKMKIGEHSHDSSALHSNASSSASTSPSSNKSRKNMDYQRQQPNVDTEIFRCAPPSLSDGSQSLDSTAAVPFTRTHSAREETTVVERLVTRKREVRPNSICDLTSTAYTESDSDIRCFINLFHNVIVLFLLCEPALRYYETGHFIDSSLAYEMFRDVWLLFLSWFRCLVVAYSAYLVYSWYQERRISLWVVRAWQVVSELSLVAGSVYIIFLEGWWIPPAGFTLLVTFVILMKMHSFTETAIETQYLRATFEERISPGLIKELVRVLPKSSMLDNNYIQAYNSVKDAVERFRFAKASSDRRVRLSSEAKQAETRAARIHRRLDTKRDKQITAFIAAEYCNWWWSLEKQNNKASGGEKFSLKGHQDIPDDTELADLLRNAILHGPLRVAIPRNYFIRYLLCPSLVFENSFPQGPRFRRGYFIKKVLWLFGAIVAMYLAVTRLVIPVMKTQTNPIALVIRMVFPMSCIFCLVFFVLFECICNLSAELTEFGDRTFYLDWWNSTTWDEFNRKWNVPVHTFLQRHVYLYAFFHWGCSQLQANAAAFIVSACMHELIMGVCFKLARFYMFCLMLTQIPLIAFGRVHRNTWFGNSFFWMGLVLGLPILCVIYSRDYVVTET